MSMFRLWAMGVGGAFLVAGPPLEAASLSGWEIHPGEGILGLGYAAPRHAAASEFELVTIPGMDDAGWDLAPDMGRVGFAQPSALCGAPVACREGVDFTYFQTFVDLSDTKGVKSLILQMTSLDDGVRVSVYNSAHPAGAEIKASWVRVDKDHPPGTPYETGNLARLLKGGEVNRVVVVLADDCCGWAHFSGVTVLLDGQVLPISGEAP